MSALSYSPDERRPPVVCPACAGDGGWDIVESAPGTFDGTRSHHQRCEACDAKGEVEDYSEPLSEDDAIERDDVLNAQTEAAR